MASELARGRRREASGPGRWLAAIAIGATLSIPSGTPALADGSSVSGVVSADLPGTGLAALGPIVVFLEAVDPGAADESPPPPVRITQKNATFQPGFLVVRVGQAVEMPNTDAIYHNVFSYSRPNDFDLGTYPAGESRTVRFEHAGVVRTYCSIHETMNATILVVPGSHFELVDRQGRFSLAGVPPGRYRLRVWCEKLPPVEREIVVSGGEPLDLAISLTSLSG
jgi:plastocyanin